MSEIETSGESNFYKCRKEVINEKWFENSQGIHGIMHAKRTLFFAIVISYLEGLSELDREVLTYSAMLHDIGRKSDNKDTKHGQWSVDKIEKLGLDKDLLCSNTILKNDDIAIIKYIIKNHARADDIGRNSITEEPDIEDKERAVRLLELFKDCDNLDMVRLSRLNANFLRSKSAKRLVVMAYQILDCCK